MTFFFQQRDVADGVMKIMNNKDIKGVTYDFVGYLKKKLI